MGEEREIQFALASGALLRLVLYEDRQGSGALQGPPSALQGPSGPQYATDAPIVSPPNLANVGLMIWHSGILLAQQMLQKPPLGTWEGIRVLDLGCGTGIVGLALSAAGADVVLADMQHIKHITNENVARNCAALAPCQPRVVVYRWGDPADAILRCWQSTCTADWASDAAARLSAVHDNCNWESGAVTRQGNAAGVPWMMYRHTNELKLLYDHRSAPLGEPPSAPGSSVHLHASPPAPPVCFPHVITCADLLYDPSSWTQLISALQALSAADTIIHFAYRLRGNEANFLHLLGNSGFVVYDHRFVDVDADSDMQWVEDSAASTDMPAAYGMFVASKLP